MLTKSKKPAYQYLRKLMVLPLVAVAIMLFSFTYSKEIKEVKQAVENKIEKFDKLMMPAVAKLKVTETVKAEVKDTVPAKKKSDAAKPDAQKFRYDTEKKTYYSMDAVVVTSLADESIPVITPPKDRIDIQSSYPGGASAWKSLLERNLRGETPTMNGARPGKYNAAVKFIIEPDGTLSNFEPVTDEGYGMEEEIIRVLKKSEKWKPALNNKDGETKPVRSYRTQPITFQVLPKNTNTGTVDVNWNQKPDQMKEVVVVGFKKEQKETDNETIFTKVEIDASYPGGSNAWRSFLERNLRGETPVERKAGPGSYTTIIQFVIDKEGNVSDVRPLTNLGYGMEEEAVRVIKLSGKWKPAILNGKEVKAYRKQPITFQIIEDKPKKS